jgi:hypothetical protein
VRETLLSGKNLEELNKIAEKVISISPKKNNVQLMKEAGFASTTYEVSKALLNSYTKYLYFKSPNLFVAAGNQNE